MESLMGWWPFLFKFRLQRMSSPASSLTAINKLPEGPENTSRASFVTHNVEDLQLGRRE